MKSKTLEREYDEFEGRLKLLRRKNEHVPEEHIRLLMKSLQHLKQELHLLETHKQARAAAGDVSRMLSPKRRHCDSLLPAEQTRQIRKAN